jgi:drug/metabolite transporter (DMT)-like permease
MNSRLRLAKIQLGAGELRALAAASAFAAGNVLTRLAAVEGSALAGSVIRLVPQIAFSLAIMALRRETFHVLLPWRRTFLGWHSIGWLALYALGVAPAAYLSLYLALKYGGVLVAVPLISTFPLFSALLAGAFLGEAFTRRMGLGLVVALLGITALTFGQYQSHPLSATWLLGALFGVTAGFTWGLSANLSAHLLRRGLAVFPMLSITSSGALGVLALGTLLLEGGGAITAFPSAQLQPLILAGAITGIANYLLFSAFAYTSVASGSALKTLDTLLASLAAVLFLGETFNFLVASGIVITVAGIFWVQLSRPQPSQPRRFEAILMRHLGQ